MRIHILTDTRLQQRFTHAQLAEMALAGGADVIQYRDKQFSLERDGEEIRRIKQLKDRYSFRLLVNDFARESALLGVDGCHVGREDAAPEKVREYFAAAGNGHPVIGATVHNLAELEALGTEGVDYIGVGPVFGTQSKNTGLPPLGLEKLTEICRQSPFPVIGIGNITPERVPDLLAAGVYGIAVLGAVCLAPDPEKAVRSFARYFQ